MFGYLTKGRVSEASVGSAGAAAATATASRGMPGGFPQQHGHAAAASNHHDDIYSFDKKVGAGPRPMTSVRAAGYSSRGRPGMTSGQLFDPFNQAGGTPAEKQAESVPEEQIKALEKKVSLLIEESAMAGSEGNLQLALEKAKEAAKRERALSKQREQAGLGDQINLDLTYCVLFNLASQYHASKLYQEALNGYAVIVKNKMFNQSGRLRVNMGNIYFEQQKFSQAVKMYRMALDQIPNTNKDIRLKIMRNIGNAFVKMGQFQDAITSFESIMESSPDYHTAFNLILCYFALGDRERMKRGFQKIVSIKMPTIEQYDEGTSPSSHEPIEDHEVFNEDSLRAIARERRRACERYLILSAKLVAPNIESSFSSGYDWVTEMIKASPHGEISSELEIAKAIQYLKTKDFKKAIETLKSFEKKDRKLVGTAATNLSFLYFLDGDYKQAEKYAELAINTDRYNAKALTNRGNWLYDKAREFYQEAVNVDAVCTEAMYNLGLANKKLGNFSDGLQWFEKLHAILRNSGEVIFQIADLFEKKGSLQQAMEWYNVLISVVPTDPGVLAKLGNLFLKDGDKSQAFQHYSESYRYFPSNMDVISWLGAYYVECEVYEHAIQFFERAAVIQPGEVKWQLMIASCYRRSGNYQQAFETYKRIHEKFPENVECLRFLVRICTDLGMKDVQEYVSRLARVEKARESTGSFSESRSSVGNRGLEDDSRLMKSKDSVAMDDRVSVRSYGTEGRIGDPTQEMPPTDRVFEYIVFRGGDIKDLKVLTLPPSGQPSPAVPNDPAIVSVGSHPGGSFPTSSAPGPAGPAPLRNLMSESGKEALPDLSKMSLSQGESPDEGANRNEGIKAVQTSKKPKDARENGQDPPTITDEDVSKMAGDSRGAQTGSKPPIPFYDRGFQGQNQGQGQPRYSDGGGNFSQNQNRGRRGGGYAGSGVGFRGGRGRNQHPNNRPATRTKIPDADYDFESANAKFNKAEIRNPKTEETAEYPIGESNPASSTDEPTSPSNFYDRTSSFFDNISCEARDRAEGERRRVRQNEERRLNMETFGQTSIDGFRGGHRRGNYRRGGRGRGSINMNGGNMNPGMRNQPPPSQPPQSF
ncbi:Intraflagellar transport protein 88 [Dinochytrium kinnereticum]|nr:Intraflagellar transport protein 88 [Dinochytrium kinnereticum]